MEGTEQVNAIVNNLSEKLGIAADKLAPIGQQAINEIHARGIVMASVFFGLWIVFLIFSCFILKYLLKKPLWDCDDPTSNGILFGILVIMNILLTIVCLMDGFRYLSEGMAPTVHLIGVLSGK